jgi:hypothetical protein
MSGGKQLASYVGSFSIDEDEAPTRQSGEILRAYARESEALLARGGDPDDAQVLVETMRCGSPQPLAASGALRPDAIVRLAVSADELGWFPLEACSAAIVAAVDGRATVGELLARAGLSLPEGLPHVAMLIDMGLVRLQ